MSWKTYEDQIDRGPIHFIAVHWRIGLFVLLLLGMTTCGIAVVTKPFSIVGGTLDSDNVKYNYEWFKSRHESIKSLNVKIKQADATIATLKKDLGPRDKWHREDRVEYSRLNTIALGLKNERSDQAAEYNARSRQINRAIFKGRDTPSEITLEGDVK